MFHKSLEILSAKHADMHTKFEKNFLEQMLKLIKIFVLAAFSIDEVEGDSVFEVMQLVKKASSSGHDHLPNKEEQELNEGMAD